MKHLQTAVVAASIIAAAGWLIVTLDGRFEAIDGRFDAIDRRLLSVEERVGALLSVDAEIATKVDMLIGYLRGLSPLPLNNTEGTPCLRCLDLPAD